MVGFLRFLVCPYFLNNIEQDKVTKSSYSKKKKKRTSIVFKVTLKRVGRALLALRTSPSTEIFSYVTSIFGTSIPTLFSHPKKKSKFVREWQKKKIKDTCLLMVNQIQTKLKSWRYSNLYLSVLSLNRRRNFSLSSSTNFKIISIRCFFSLGASFVRSTSSSPILPLTVVCGNIPFLNRSNVGNLSSAAHRSSTSSSSRRSLLPNTSSPGGTNTSLNLFEAPVELRWLVEAKLPLPLIVRTRSSSRPSIIATANELSGFELWGRRRILKSRFKISDRFVSVHHWMW